MGRMVGVSGDGPAPRSHGRLTGNSQPRSVRYAHARRAAAGPAHILVVDDEPAITDLLATALRYMGYRVSTAATGHAALDAAASAAPDLVVLDVMLPDIDGFEVCRRLRDARDFVPVIFLSARDTEDDRVTGLRPRRRRLRHQAVLARGADAADRRAPAARPRRRRRPTPRLRYRDLEMDEDRHQVWRGGDEVELSPTEFRLLRYFLLNPERVLSKQQILDHVWQYDFNGEDNVVETYVSYLRRKVDVAEPRLLRTVRGFGYVLRADGRDRATADADATARRPIAAALAPDPDEPARAAARLAGGDAVGRARSRRACSLVELTRASLVDRVDRELLGAQRPGRPAPAARQPRGRRQRRRPAPRGPAPRPPGQRRPVLSRRASRATPDPLPSLPVYAGGHPGRGLRPDRGAAGRRRLHAATASLTAAVAAGTSRSRSPRRWPASTPRSRRAGPHAAADRVARARRAPRRRLVRRPPRPAAARAHRRGRPSGSPAGDLSHRAGVPHDGTEVGRLGTAFDAMLDQIETSFGEQQAALEAKAASEERLRRFVADASHELRTPLTAVRGYADLYRAGGLADPDELAHGDGPDRDREPADGRARRRPAAARPARPGPAGPPRPGRPVADRRRRRRRRPGPRARPADRRRDRAGRRRRRRRGSPAPGGRQPARQRPGPHAGRDAGRGRRRGPTAATPSCGSSTTARASTRPSARRVFDRFYRADPGRSRDNGGTGPRAVDRGGRWCRRTSGRIWHEATPGGGATFVVRLPMRRVSTEAAVATEPAAASPATASSAANAAHSKLTAGTRVAYSGPGQRVANSSRAPVTALHPEALREAQQDVRHPGRGPARGPGGRRGAREHRNFADRRRSGRRAGRRIAVAGRVRRPEARVHRTRR